MPAYLFLWELRLTVSPRVIHFTLFVGACVETHKRNAARPVVMVTGDMPQTVYAPQPMPMPPMHMQQQYPMYPQQAHMSMYSAPLSSQPAEMTVSSASPPLGHQEPKGELAGTNVTSYNHSHAGTDSVSVDTPYQQQR
jgi:hypothetical protein